MKDLNIRGLCRHGAIRTRLWNRIDWWERWIFEEVRPLGLWRLHTTGTRLRHVTGDSPRGVRGLFWGQPEVTAIISVTDYGTLPKHYLVLSRITMYTLTRSPTRPLTRSITPYFLRLLHVYIPLDFHRFTIKSLVQFLHTAKLTALVELCAELRAGLPLSFVLQSSTALRRGLAAWA